MNDLLLKAKLRKKDEFYTQMIDIENTLQYYKSNLKNKIIYCNCDNYETSNFWKFFYENFYNLQLKKIICTNYSENNNSFKVSYSGKGILSIEKLKGNGDFRSPECIRLLKQADIIITNPPFSLFQEYMSKLIKYKKHFLIIGNQNAITYKNIFPLIQSNKIFMDYNFPANVGFFVSPYENISSYKNNHGLIRVSGVTWFTNLKSNKKRETLVLHKSYFENEKLYPLFHNYQAINVDKVQNIPYDYTGIMGVPITFLEKYSPEQFEILGLSSKNFNDKIPRFHPNSYYDGYVRGKVVTRMESNLPILQTPTFGGTLCTRENSPDLYQLYWRIFIKHKIKK